MAILIYETLTIDRLKLHPIHHKDWKKQPHTHCRIFGCIFYMGCTSFLGGE